MTLILGGEWAIYQEKPKNAQKTNTALCCMIETWVCFTTASIDAPNHFNLGIEVSADI